jgi:hypothetical protein
MTLRGVLGSRASFKGCIAICRAALDEKHPLFKDPGLARPKQGQGLLLAVNATQVLIPLVVKQK